LCLFILRSILPVVLLVIAFWLFRIDRFSYDLNVGGQQYSGLC
jgi:hypothetical protein